jgi:phosphopantetheinyl transferase (holo-ACP synthase)
MKVGTDIVEISRIPADNLAFVHGVSPMRKSLIFDQRKDKAQFIAGSMPPKKPF